MKPRRATPFTQKRKVERLEGEQDTLASIAIPDAEGNYERVFSGLLVNESHQGCGIVMPATATVQVGAQCMVRIGRSTRRAEVRWHIPLDSDVVRVGLLYLD